MRKIDLAETELVLIDWSGVVSDDRLPVYEAGMRMLEHRGRPRMTFTDWLSQTTASIREFMHNCGFVEDPEELQREYSHRFAKVTREGLKPTAYTDAKAFLERLVGMEIQTTVISAHPTEHLLTEARDYGINHFIRRFVGDARNKAHEIAMIAGGRPEETVVYIGDTIFDVRSGKEACVRTVAVATGYHSRDRLAQESPDILVDSLSELGTLFHA